MLNYWIMVCYKEDGSLEIDMSIEIKYILLEMLAPGLVFINEILSSEIW
jgi:hypothetical protein